MRSSTCAVGLVGCVGLLLVATSCGKSNGLLPPADGSASGLPPAASCTATPVAVTEAKSLDSISENVDATCAAVVGFVDWKMNATGAACATPTDCSPVCVPCPNGTHHSFATWCNHGLCAAPADVACAVAGTSGLAGCSP